MSINFTKLSYDDYFKEYHFLTDCSHVFVNYDFNDLMELFKESFTGIIYIGGPWCPNCQAIVPFVNEVAQKLKIEKVINFDFLGHDFNLRNGETEIEKTMYLKLCNTLGIDVNLPLYVPTLLMYNNSCLVKEITHEYIYEEMLDFEKELLIDELLSAFNLIGDNR